jgi:hypothetical protein
MAKAEQVGHQARGRGDDQRVAHQLAHKAALRMACHGPDGGHVEQRHAHADQHRNQQQALRARQPLGQRQADERIEAKRHLRAGRVVAPVDVPAQQRQVGQAVRQRNAAMPSSRPAPIRLDAAPRSRGLFTMDWNSSTGNRK